MRKIVKAMALGTAVSILFGSEAVAAVFPAYVANSLPGTIVEEVTENQAMDTNNGTVILNKGYVKTNNGTITTNQGSVEENKGTIDRVTVYGSVDVNSKTIEENEGGIATNGDGGHVTTNTGFIDINNGEVGINEGQVAVNNGAVAINDFSGTVTNAAAGSGVILNVGTVKNAKETWLGMLVYDADGDDYFGVTYGETMSVFDMVENPGSFKSGSVKKGTSISVLDGMEKSGYDFVKWLCVDPDANETYYRGGESITVLSPLWFTPVWTEHWEDIAPTVTGTADAPVSGGRWFKNPSGQWFYMTSGTFRNCWGYIENPSAKNENDRYGWFRFDRDGVMLTGWQEIDGVWYYFSTDTTDGTYGMCLLDTTTPDGYKVDKTGAWIK